MRKIILLFVIMLLIVTCDPPIYYHKGEWYVKNYTEQTLTITFPLNENNWSNRKVLPGDSIGIAYFGFEYRGKTKPYFYGFMPPEMVSLGENLLLNVLSENGNLLKKWYYLDKDLPDKQFFKESSWRYYENMRSGDKITAIWVFDIMPEDIIEKDD